MIKNYCVGGKRQSEIQNQNLYEKVNPKTKEVIKFIQG